MATKIMTKIRYKLVFNRGGRLNQCGEGLVQIECTQNHRRIYFSTHTYLQPNQFSRCCVVNHELADNLNYALYKMMHEIENIELEYIKRGVVVTLPMLREAYRSHLSPGAKLRDFGINVIDDSMRKQLTKRNYLTLFNDLDKYRSGTYITDIDYNYVVGYDKYLRGIGVQHNTRVSRLRLLRALLNEARKRDIIDTNPFDRFRIQQMVSKKGYLPADKLRKLEAMKLDGNDDIVRDAFLVGCYTGLRFSDIRTLRKTDIHDGWIVKKMVKTGFEVEIPVSDKMAGIIGKYGDIGKLAKNLGVNSQVNATLRVLLDSIGADAKITFHSSRHTFATLLGQKGVQLTTIQRLLGHQKLQTTQIYSEVDRTAILNDLRGTALQNNDNTEQLKNDFDNGTI